MSLNKKNFLVVTIKKTPYPCRKTLGRGNLLINLSISPAMHLKILIIHKYGEMHILFFLTSKKNCPAYYLTHSSHNKCLLVRRINEMIINNKSLVLAGLFSWLELCPIHQKGCGFVDQ